MKAKHKHSEHWQYGLYLSLVACFFWGILPILLVGLLPDMDAMTITFYRFSIAAIFLLAWLIKKNNLKPLVQLKKGKLFSRVLAASLLLTANYSLYVFALERMSPTGAQVLIQLAPVLLLLSGVFIFKEVFLPIQWLGFLIFLSGLTLFFWNRILEMKSSLNEYGVGMLIMIVAAIAWAAYASLQKQLLIKLNSVQLMFLFNLIGAISLFWLSDLSALFQLSGWQLVLLFLCGINTLIAYGSFTEALEHWEASKISAMFSIVPLLTIIMIELLNAFTKLNLQSEPLTPMLIIGALLVVAGAACTSLGHQLSKNKIRGTR